MGTYPVVNRQRKQCRICSPFKPIHFIGKGEIPKGKTVGYISWPRERRTPETVAVLRRGRRRTGRRLLSDAHQKLWWYYDEEDDGPADDY